jgi:hypothetical protein
VVVEMRFGAADEDAPVGLAGAGQPGTDVLVSKR